MDFGLNRWNAYELTAPDGWEADLDAGGMEDEWMRRCDALGYMGMTLGGNTYLPDLPFGEVGNWAYDTLWHAVWMPDDMTVGEAECARDYLDREGLKDLDPAWDSLPLRWWDTPEEFKASEYAEPFLRRFGLDEGDLDRLAKACLEHGDVLDDWHTVTDARKVGERLRKG